ncbi:sigma-54-dependent transcriptional regulator [Pelobacter propionicus]|uniref:Two component, sigma54 specific, transcriptional regulator, Fis family n=1 Tax=Pelobacter propionicus (strain DSM 2379 / NBRC 103807 / OttBd1) TaxID=338966 RepID=A1ATN1_PELPD|nr:sigma-54 dependent transcriptional regulator [Pelobacter propionicus]ABL00702.1 two component, sigma54 specific, transcriptional regulator, Fis family [Pelobacter propionicus DSM 2379]
MPQNQIGPNPESRILIVDDEGTSLLILENYLQHHGHVAICAANGREALALLKKQPVDLVISDLVMPGMGGIEFMDLAKERHPGLPFIFYTALGSIESAVSAIKQGAFDYLEKPLDPKTFDVVIQRALEFARLSHENVQLREHFAELFSFQNIVTQSPAMRTVLELASRVAASPRTTVSLTGESGTGKEVLARAIHFASGCLPSNFVAVNCAAIPEALLESELFGHVRGAFTGAERDREGKFSLARGGTVLLDEIGDMPLPLQAKLLRVLEERTFEKVGDNRPQPVDFRVIVATYRDLAQLVRKGRFREDLYHRINVVPIAIPPLRERLEDIPLLVDFFLKLFRQHQGKALPGVSKKAMDLLIAHSWPGNVRELRNVLEYAAIMVSDELIRPEHLRLSSSSPSASALPSSSGTVEFHISLPAEDVSLDAVVSRVLESALQRCHGNKSRAAALLKVNRKMFYR